MYVLDATPLIYLAKTDHLDVLAEVPEQCLIPERIENEVVTTGHDEGYPDARRIEEAIQNGILTVVSAPQSDVFERLQRNEQLTAADSAVLAVAADRNGVAVMDEQYGRDIAAVENIPTRGTVYLVLSVVKEGEMPVERADRLIDEMIERGWYCSPRLYKRIQNELDELH